MGGVLSDKNKQIAALRSATPATAATATVTVTSAINTATPMAQCSYPSSGLNITEDAQYHSGLTYTLFCNTDFGTGQANNLFGGVAFTMQDCLDLCDSYNYNSMKYGDYAERNLTMANWDWVGFNETPGRCFCTYAEPGYTLKASTSRHSAFLAGSFDISTIPGASS